MNESPSSPSPELFAAGALGNKQVPVAVFAVISIHIALFLVLLFAAGCRAKSRASRTFDPATAQNPAAISTAPAGAIHPPDAAAQPPPPAPLPVVAEPDDAADSPASAPAAPKRNPGIPASAPAARNRTFAAYTVQPGDTVEKIAKRHGTTIESIRQGNGLKNDMIRPGQKLRVGAAAARPSNNRSIKRSTQA